LINRLRSNYGVNTAEYLLFSTSHIRSYCLLQMRNLSNEDPHYSGSAPSGKSLLTSVSRGDLHAFRQLYDQYWHGVFATALKWTRSKADAEDVVQEVFFKIWNRKELLPDILHFSAYLHTMARHEILSSLKAKPSGFAVEGLEQTLEDEQPDAVGLLSLKELEQTVRAAVDSLPPQQKLVYNLTRQEGLSHEEIAQRLGVTKETISNHATRALSHIRRYLKVHPYSAVIVWEILQSCWKKN
jgi:RNA polymerase sigma-70 factor (family 1)